jgi:tetratricopeptide (TPR) repeat protein
MHDALIGELAKITGLRVISRTSAMRYKERRRAIPEVARELNVDAVLEGSVFRAADSVRIQLQLLGTRPERHLWTGRYESGFSDLLALHRKVADTVARQISTSLGGTLHTSTRRDSLGGRKPRPAAYNEFLLGRYYMATAPPTLEAAIKHFERAIAIDSTYAAAYASLAESYHWYAYAGFPAYFARSRVAGRMALDLDASLPEAHVAAALGRMNDWDWEGAEASLKQAIALSPSSAAAHQWYGWFLRATMRLDEAMREARRTVDLDPYSLIARTMVGWVYFSQNRHDDAHAVYRDVLKLEPEFGIAIYNHGLSYWIQGRSDKVVESARRSNQVRLPVGDLHSEWQLSIGQALGGQADSARARLARLEARFGPGVWFAYKAAFHLVLNDEEKALALLDSSFAIREPMLPLVTSEPVIDRLREHPRFRALRAAMRAP